MYRDAARTHRYRPLLGALLAAAMVGQLQAAPARAQEARLHPHFQAGLEHLKHNNLSQARSALLAALLDRPNDPQIHFTIAVCYYRMDQLASAERSFQQALALQPPANLAAQARAGLGDVYLRALRTVDAIQQYDQAIGFNPRWPGVRLSRARAYYLERNYSASLYDVEQILTQETPPLAEALELRGLIRWRQNELVGAMSDLEMAVARQAQPARGTYLNLIELYRQNHLYPQAVAVGQKLLNGGDGQAESYRELGDTYLQWYRYRNGQVPSMWPMPFADGPRDATAVQLLQGAIDAYWRSAMLDPTATGLRRELGELYRLSGQPMKAAELYLRMLEQDPGDWASLLTLSRALLAAGRPEQARKVAVVITQRFTREPAGWLNLAVVADRLEEPQLAAEALARAAELAPDKPDILFYTALRQQRHGGGPGLEGQWGRVIETHPNSFYATLAHGYKALNRGDQELAEMYYQLASKFDPDSSAVSFFGGEVAYASGHNAQAIERLSRASALDDTDWHIYYRLGELYARQDQPVAARLVYRHLVATNLKHGPAQTAMLRIFERQQAAPR